MGMYGARPPGHRRRMLFGGNKALFRYNAGDSLAAATFTRGSTATYVDANGVIQTALSNVPRDGHYIGGARSLLIEGARTNICLRSQQFDNASWAKANVTVTADAVVAPDGTMTADKIAATTAAATSINQTSLAAPGSSVTYSVYIQQGTGAAIANRFLLRNETTSTNLIGVTINFSTLALAYIAGAAGAIATNAGGGWIRLSLSVASGVTLGDTLTAYCGFTANTPSAGDFLYAWGGQVEAGAFPSSYIATTTAAVTRATDLLFFPFNYTPFALTVYTKHIELGMGLAVSNGGLWSIGNGGTSPYLRCYSNVGGGQAYSVNASFTAGGSFSDITAALAIGDTVEVCAGVSGTGALSAIGRLSRNGGADIVGGTGGAKTPDPAWATRTILYVGAERGITGYCAILAVKAKRDVGSMADMRAL